MNAMYNRQTIWVLVMIIVVVAGCRIPDAENPVFRTISNPLNLNYRFCLDDVSRRDAANPCIVQFEDGYYLFLFGSGGYYYSSDLIEWKLIDDTNLPTESFAPTVVEMQGELYYTASYATDTIYKTDSPKSGIWEAVACSFPPGMLEPMLFYDEGRLYLYAGAGNSVSLTGVEVDPRTFQLLGEPSPLIRSRQRDNGWETPGDHHDLSLIHI